MSLKHSACHAFRALPLPDGAFLHSSVAGASRGQFFSRFLRFWCVLGGPAGAFLVQIVVKKVLRKKRAKLSENGSRYELQPGPAESLKQKNWQLQIWEELRNKRGGPDTLLVPEARWRIYICKKNWSLNAPAAELWKKAPSGRGKALKAWQALCFRDI